MNVPGSENTGRKNYRDECSAREYLSYRLSLDGRLETEILFSSITPVLPLDLSSRILDMGCGDGWLTRKIRETHTHTLGCDISPLLLSEALRRDPLGDYRAVDVEGELPYERESFHMVLSVMMLHDVSNIERVAQNAFDVLQEEGMLVVFVANPYYSYPVGVWKRGLWGRMLFRKPMLFLRSYGALFRKESRKFLWHGEVPSFFRTMPEYIESALRAGFLLEKMRDVLASSDSASFDRRFQLYRFPLIVQFVFRKPKNTV